MDPHGFGESGEHLGEGFDLPLCFFFEADLVTDQLVDPLGETLGTHGKVGF